MPVRQISWFDHVQFHSVACKSKSWCFPRLSGLRLWVFKILNYRSEYCIHSVIVQEVVEHKVPKAHMHLCIARRVRVVGAGLCSSPRVTFGASLRVGALSRQTTPRPATTIAIRITNSTTQTYTPTYHKPSYHPRPHFHQLPLGQDGFTHALRHAFLRTRLLFRPSTAHCIRRP